MTGPEMVLIAFASAMILANVIWYLLKGRIRR